MIDWLYTTVFGYYHSFISFKRYMCGQLTVDIEEYGAYKVTTMINQISDPLFDLPKLIEDKEKDIAPLAADTKQIIMDNEINKLVMRSFYATIAKHPYKCFLLIFTAQNKNILVMSPPRHDSHVKLCNLFSGQPWLSLNGIGNTTTTERQQYVWSESTRPLIPSLIKEAQILDLDLFALPA